MLPVEIQARKYPFVLDTGTSITTFDTSLRSLLGKPGQSGTMHTSDGELCIITYSSPAGKLGHLNLPSMSEVACMDLGRFRELSGDDMYGLLGMDFLGKRVFRIDFDRREVTFLRSAGPDSGVRIPISFHNSVPQVHVTIPGLPGQEVFQLDSGFASAGDGVLRAEVFDSLSEQRKLKLAGDVKAETLSSSGKVKVGRLEQISLGEFCHKDLVFSRSSNANAFGINYLSRYVVTFDCPNRAIYLKKGCQFDCSQKGRKGIGEVKDRKGKDRKLE